MLFTNQVSERFELTNQLAGRLQNWGNIRHFRFWRISHQHFLLRCLSLARLTLFSQEFFELQFLYKILLQKAVTKVKQRMTADKLIADVFTSVLSWRHWNSGISDHLEWCAKYKHWPPLLSNESMSTLLICSPFAHRLLINARDPSAHILRYRVRPGG